MIWELSGRLKKAWYRVLLSCPNSSRENKPKEPKQVTKVTKAL